MKDQRKGSEAPRLSKVGSVGIPIEQFPERSRASLIKFDANGDNSIKSVTLPPVDGVARGYTVQGFAWYNTTDLDLYLSLDRTLHIVGEMIFVSKTSETGELNRRRMPLPALVVAGLIFVGSAVGSAVVGYYVEMGLDAMHEALAAEEEEEESPPPE